MMDVDWYNNLKSIDSASGIELGHDPFACLDHFSEEAWKSRPKTAAKIYDFPFFTQTAKAIKQLRDRVLIEVTYGDYVDIAEKIRFGMYRDSDSASSISDQRSTRPKEFPTSYDRIHLSNVP